MSIPLSFVIRGSMVAVACATLVASDAATSAARDARTVAARDAAARRPFAVGERLRYDVKVNFLHAGSAAMSVESIETVRGRPAYHTIFELSGRILFFKVRNHYESWFDTTTLSSLRMVQEIDEGRREETRKYEFYPERRVYVKNGEEKPSVAEPLDEGSFLYFLRTVPLEVGRTYRFARYYHPDRNPVVIQVLRREHIRVPAGEFDAIVVHPVIKSHGLFSEDGDAQVWIADDSTRRILQLRSRMSVGTLYLELASAEYASADYAARK